MGDIIEMSGFRKEPVAITLEDEDGNKMDVLVLDIVDVDYKGTTYSYAVLLRQDIEDDSLILTRYTLTDPENPDSAVFGNIDDEEEFKNVIDFMEKA